MILTFTDRIEASQCLRALLRTGHDAHLVKHSDGTFSVHSSL